MNEKQNARNDEGIEALGRWLGRSRIGRTLVAAGILSAFAWFASLAWHDRELSATLLTVGFLIYGLQLAWRVLPIPGATRARWLQQEKKAVLCQASAYRFVFWVGLAEVIVQFTQSDSAKPIVYSDYLIPVVFMLVGVVSYILVRRFVSREQSR